MFDDGANTNANVSNNPVTALRACTRRKYLDVDYRVNKRSGKFCRPLNRKRTNEPIQSLNATSMFKFQYRYRVAVASCPFRFCARIFGRFFLHCMYVRPTRVDYRLVARAIITEPVLVREQ